MKLKTITAIKLDDDEKKTVTLMDGILDRYCEETNCDNCPLRHGNYDRCLGVYWDEMMDHVRAHEYDEG